MSISEVICRFRTWWYGDSTAITRRKWRTYFYFHLVVVVYITTLAVFDARGCSVLMEAMKNGPMVIRLALGALFLISILGWPVMLLVAIHMIRLARHSGASFLALGLVDLALLAVQWFAILAGYM